VESEQTAVAREGLIDMFPLQITRHHTRGTAGNGGERHKCAGWNSGGTGHEPLSSYCEPCNEHSGSINKERRATDLLSDYQILKKDFAL
jgi:hypothetical protein